MIELIDYIMVDDRINKDALIEDLTTMLEKNKENYNVVAVVDKVITKEDGTEMYEFLGTNATTIGGTQTIVENTFDNLNPRDVMDLLTVDNATLPENWTFDRIAGTLSKSNPRKIFGFMFADDGAVGKTLKIVDRRTKAFDINHIMPFRRMDIRSDNAKLYMQVGEFGENKDINNPVLMAQVRRGIDDGKYALRVNINSTGFNDTAYFAKLARFDFQNILVDGSRLESNESTRRPGLDVRSKISTIISVDPEELSDSFAHNNGTRNIKGSMVSSILLVAGRPTKIMADDQIVDSYRDVIVTNRINFIELPVEETELKFRYTLYFV